MWGTRILHVTQILSRYPQVQGSVYLYNEPMDLDLSPRHSGILQSYATDLKEATGEADPDHTTRAVTTATPTIYALFTCKDVGDI